MTIEAVHYSGVFFNPNLKLIAFVKIKLILLSFY